MSEMVERKGAIRKAAATHSTRALALHQAARSLRVARDYLTLAGSDDLASEVAEIATRADRRRQRTMRKPALDAHK